MSTPTTIQTHIASELMVDHDRGVVVSTTAGHLSESRPMGRSDSSRFSRAGNLAGQRAGTGYEAKNVAAESSEKRDGGTGAASLDDFGGHSDALGG